MLAVVGAPARSQLASAIQTRQQRFRRTVRVSAVNQCHIVEAAESADVECPWRSAESQSKTSCVHPARPLSSACGDCPRRKKMAAMQPCMAKSKCVHPQRPVSNACADCPRRK